MDTFEAPTEEWISIDNPQEYVEVTVDDIQLDRFDECINGEESVSYLKSLLHRERQDRLRLMTKQMDKNNQLEQQLDMARKQNIKLQQDLKFMESRLKHQQNNSNNLRIDDNKNVVSKIWSAFKQKSNSQHTTGQSDLNKVRLDIVSANLHIFYTIMIIQKLHQIEQSIHNVQSLQRSMDLNDVQNYKESMDECMRNLQLSFEDLSKSITIK